MSWRPTFLLAAAACALVYIAYRDVVREDPSAGWQTIFEEPQPTPPYSAIERLLDFAPKSVVALRVERRQQVVETRRTAYGWSGIGNPSAVNEFLDAVAELAVIIPIRSDGGDADLANYGLATPQGQVVLDLEQGEPLRLTLGRHNPSATGIYALTNRPERLVLTGAVALWDLDKLMTAVARHSAPDT